MRTGKVVRNGVCNTGGHFCVHFWLVLVMACFIASFSIPDCFGQQFGGNPPTMRWKKIDTDTVRVIFPENMDMQAQRVANIVHYLNKNYRQSIGDRQMKIDIVLQNQPVISNGYVGLAPFRSELYLNAPQNNFDLGSNWLDLLSIHEYRHALQFMNTQRGLTRAAYFLTGELGWGYISQLSIPNWFWEGDAIVSETALTAQGRGRIPSFYNGYKGLVFNDRVYNYQKARNNSLKDYVPNHYELGFLLCNYGRAAYDGIMWKNVIEDAARYKSIFYPFSGALKRHTGMGTRAFYDKSIDFYQSKWMEDYIPEDQSEVLNEADNKKVFTTYEYPHRLENGDLLVYRASFDRIGGFYSIDSAGKERLIRNQGRVLDNYFSFKSGKIVWAELGQDERWAWKSYSNIVTFDIRTNTRKRLNHQKRYFSPDITSDGSRIVVFEVTPELKYRLNIISAESGDLLKQVDNPDNYFFSYPKWSLDEKHILALARDAQGRTALIRIEVESGRFETIIPFTNHQLGIPSESKDYIFLAASFTGVDNIFAFDKQTGELFRVTNGRIGSYQAFSGGGQLVFSRFSPMGNDIRFMNISPQDWEEYSLTQANDVSDFNFLSLEAEGTDITGEIPSGKYETKPYSKASKLINVHSWSLYFEDPNYEWAIRSNNILNTLNMNLGVRYNRNDEAFTYFFNAAYGQYYPLLTASASIGKRNVPAQLVDENNNPVGMIDISWWESSIRPGISLPFNFSSGLYNRQLNLSGFYSYTDVRFTDQTREQVQNIQDFSYDSYTTGFTWINRRKKARQNIFAKYSQYMAFSYDRLIDNERVEQIFADSEWTFPGLMPNHNIVFQAALQQEDPVKFPRFGDNFFYARGYNRPVYDLIYKVGTNYHLPLLYPDWGFWGIAYLYRVRTNLFFDYSRSHFTPSGTDAETVQLYNSIGTELILDTRLLNLYDFTFGFRYSYLLNEDPAQPELNHVFEFFIPVMRF